jgi:HJR/Mrr/RecB family endonuclease
MVAGSILTVVVGGAAVGGGGVSAYVLYNKYRWRQVKQQYDDLHETATSIQERINESATGLQERIDDADPAYYSSVEEAKAEYAKLSDELDEYRKIVDRHEELRERYESVAFESENFEDGMTNVLAPVRQANPDNIDVANSELNTAETILKSAELQTALGKRLSEFPEETPFEIETAKRHIDSYNVENKPEQVHGVLEAYDTLVRDCQRLQEIREWDNRVPTEDLVKRLNDAIRKSKPSEVDVSEAVSELMLLREPAESILDVLEDMNPDNPAVNQEKVLAQVDTAIENGDPSLIEDLSSKMEGLSKTAWTAKHLRQYDWQQFEQLIGRLWEDKGYSTEVTQGSGDRGVDVFARKSGETVAIQAKHNSKSNRVGRPPVQKLGGILATNDADRAIVVTSASFTGTAKEEADNFGDGMELIPRSELLQMLNESELIPPESNPSPEKKSSVESNQIETNSSTEKDKSGGSEVGRDNEKQPNNIGIVRLFLLSVGSAFSIYVFIEHSAVLSFLLFLVSIILTSVLSFDS